MIKAFSLGTRHFLADSIGALAWLLGKTAKKLYEIAISLATEKT